MAGLAVAEQKFIEELLAKDQRGEPPLWQGIVSSGRPGKKKEKKILVVGSYRLYFIKKATGGVRKVTKNPHFFDLAEIAGPGRDRVTLKWNPPVKDLAKDKKKDSDSLILDIEAPNVPDIVHIIRTQYSHLTTGIPEEYQYRLIVAEKTSLKPIAPPVPGPGHGITDTYKAWQNYFGCTMETNEFIRYVEDQVEIGSCDLDLSELPGIEEKSEATIDTSAALASLRHNTFFVSLVIENVTRSQLVLAVAELLRTNRTLTKLVLSVGSVSPNFNEIGQALVSNRYHAIQILDLSNNKLDSKSITSLTEAIVASTHGWKVLKLANCHLQDKHLVSLMYGFGKNFGVSLSFEEFDLSGNTFSKTGSAQFEDWLSRANEYSHLRRLLLSGNNVNITSIGKPLLKMKYLVEVNLSNNKIDHGGSQLLASALENTVSVRSVDVSGCSLQGDWAVALFKAFALNTKIDQTYLNLGYNNLGDKDLESIANVITKTCNLSNFNLTGNNFTEKGLCSLLTSLGVATRLRTLVLNKNFNDGPGSDRVASSLFALISGNPSLRCLHLSGGWKKVAMKLLSLLGPNETLEELDISKNKGGDMLAAEIAEFLRTNRWLSSLNVDENGFTLTGYAAIRAALRRNESLQLLVYPWRDIEKAMSGDQPSNKTKLRHVLDDIQHFVRGNYRGFVPFDISFVLPKEPTPTTIKPLVDVPPHLVQYASQLVAPVIDMSLDQQDQQQGRI